MQTILDHLAAWAATEQATAWQGTFPDYLALVRKDPRLARSSHARLADCIREAGMQDGPEGPQYAFFADQLFGIDKAIRLIMEYLVGAAQRLDVRKRVLLLIGPPGGGKSSLVILLKRALEAYTRTDAGALYAIASCPLHEDPLHVVPQSLRSAVAADLGIPPIEGELCPVCALAWQTTWARDVAQVPVTRVVFSERDRVGIGTFVPADPKDLDISQLLGALDFSQIATYGSESDPRAYRFDGEFMAANRGLLEFQEWLKLPREFMYHVLSLAQEANVKLPRYGLLSVDEVIVAHSVAGHTQIPFLLDGHLRVERIESLDQYDPSRLRVLAVNLTTRSTEWTRVRQVIKHRFVGRMLTSVQKHGVVETTDAHTIYDRDYGTFQPDEQHDMLTIRQIPAVAQAQRVTLEVPGELCAVSGDDSRYLVTPNARYHRGTSPLQRAYETPEEIRDLLTVVAAYLTNGHLDAPARAVVSKKEPEYIQELVAAFRRITRGGLKRQRYPGTHDRRPVGDVIRAPLYCRSLVTVLRELCGEYATGKRIPPFVFSLPLDHVRFFVEQMVNGDGTWYDRPTPVLGRAFGYKTGSEAIATGLGVLLGLLGEPYSVYTETLKSGVVCYTLRTVMRQDPHKGLKKVWERQAFMEWTWDIECEGNHNFVCGVGNVVCHNSNLWEFDRFLGSAEHEAMKNRVYLVQVPYALRVQDEVRIYESMLREGATDVGHLAPPLLALAAWFSVLSRLEPPQDASLSLVDKLRLYNGEAVQEIQEHEVRALHAQHPREGLTGLSPRDALNVLAHARGFTAVPCVTPVDYLRAVKAFVEEQRFLVMPGAEAQKRLTDLLALVRAEYDRQAKETIMRAFVHAFDTAAQTLFEAYLQQAEASLDKQKVPDPLTGELRDPDLPYLRAIEEHVGVGEQAATPFREEMVRKAGSAARRGETFRWDGHPRLKEGIEKRLFADVRVLVQGTLGTKTPDPEQQEKRDEVVQQLITQEGYCRHCASALIAYAGELVKREGQ